MFVTFNVIRFTIKLLIPDLMNTHKSYKNIRRERCQDNALAIHAASEASLSETLGKRANFFT